MHMFGHRLSGAAAVFHQGPDQNRFDEDEDDDARPYQKPKRIADVTIEIRPI